MNAAVDAADTQAAPGTAPAEEAAPAANDWKDKYLRLAAEWDNFRKRAAREFGDLVRGAERDLIGDLTEVFDDLVRAVGADHKGQSVEQFAQGVTQIQAKFWSTLEKRGLERLVTVGTPFNPEEHDAMMRLPSDEYDEGIVVQEISPGYRLGGKILRHARVVVSQGKLAE
jgi:molecular chaperone GrpE